MSKIDERIVGIRFDNKQFAQGAQDTLKDLEHLKKGLNLDGIGEGVDKVASRFSAFGGIAFSALNRLTNSAIDFGQKIAGAVLDPLVQGGERRALNIEQARFQFEGLGMDVEASMASALAAVKGTAYGLDEAAVVAAQFGASGMAAGDDMTKALLGISGVAAMAGASYSDIGSVFTKVAGQGRLMGDDLNRLAVRGVNAAATLVDYFNKTGDGANYTEEQVRKMVTKGQIDFQTFADAMSDAFGEHATKANETYTGSLSNMRAAISRVGAEFAASKFEKHRQIFNAIAPAVDKVFAALEPIFKLNKQMSMDSASGMVAFIEGIDFSDLTNAMRFVAIGIKNFRRAVDTYLTPIKNAFRDVFPPSTPTILTTIAKAFANVTRAMSLGHGGQKALYTVFKGIFTILKTGVQIVTGTGRVFGALLGLIWDVVSALLSLVKPIGSLFSGIRIEASETEFDLVAVFDRIVEAINWLREKGIEPAAEAFRRFTSYISEMIVAAGGLPGIIENVREFFSAGSSGGGFTLGATWASVVDWVQGTLIPALSKAETAWEWLKIAAEVTWEQLKVIGNGIKNFFSGLGIEFKMPDFGTAMAVGNLGMLGGLIYMMNDLRRSFSGWGKIGDSIRFVLGKDGVRGYLKALQNEVKANIVLKIAVAIAVLAASLYLLSKVEIANLGAAVGALTILGTALSVMMKNASAMTSSKDLAKLPLLGIALTVFAGAILILAAALKIMSSMSWKEMGVGLISLTVAMGLLSGVAVVLSKIEKDILRGSVAMIAMASAVLIMAAAVLAFGMMPVDVLIQGGIAITVITTVLAGAATLMGRLAKNMLAGGAGLLLMAAAINALIVPILALGYMPIDVLLQGGIALGIILGALSIFGVIVGRFSGGLLAAGAGIMLMAVALNMLIVPVVILGSLPFEKLQQGMLAVLGIFGAMALLSNLLGTMKGISGAAALIALAQGTMILATAITILSKLDPQAMWIAIAGIAAAIGVLLIAGALGVKVAPGLIALSIAIGALSLAVMLGAIAMVIAAPAILALGGAMLLLGQHALTMLKGAGALAAISVALALFGVAATLAGIGVMALGAGLTLIGMGLALIGFTAALGASGMSLLVVTMASLTKFIPDLLKMSATFLAVGVGIAVLGAGALVLGVGFAAAGLGALVLAAAIVVAGVGLALVGAGIAAIGGGLVLVADGFTRLGEAARTSGDDIVKMAVDLMGTIPVLFAELANGIVTFIEIILEAGPSIVEAFFEILTVVADEFILFIPKLEQIATDLMIAFGNALNNGAPSIIEAIANIISLLLEKVRELTPQFKETVVTLAFALLDAFDDIRPRLLETLGETITDILDFIVEKVPEMAAAAVELVEGLIQGVADNIQGVIDAGTDLAVNFMEGIGNNAEIVADAAGQMVVDVLVAIETALDNHAEQIEESARNIGGYILQGLTFGLYQHDGGNKDPEGAARMVADKTLEALAEEAGVRSPSTRAIEIGKNIDEGLAIGLEDNAGMVSSAAEGVSNASLITTLLSVGVALTTFGKVSKAASGVVKSAFDDVIKSLVDAGVRVKASIDIMSNSFSSLGPDISRNASNARTNVTSMTGDIVDALRRGESDIRTAIRNIDGVFLDFGNDIRTRSGSARTNTRTMMDDVARSARDGRSIIRSGLNYAVGAFDSFSSNISSRRGAAQNAASGVVGSARTGITNSRQSAVNSAITVGRAIANGLSSGINNRASTVRDTAARVARTALTVARKVLGIRSPSRETFKMGEQFDEGFVGGIEDGADGIVRASGGMGEMAIKALQRSLRAIDITLDGFENPVITPVLDLSQVRASARELASIFGSPVASSMAHNISAAQARQAQISQEEFTKDISGSGTTFVQNNYSPKELSTIDIYRQTKNLISLPKKGS